MKRKSYTYVVIMLNYLAGQLLLQLVPLVRASAPLGPIMNLALLVLMLIGLPLSIRHRSVG